MKEGNGAAKRRKGDGEVAAEKSKEEREREREKERGEQRPTWCVELGGGVR